MKKLKKLGLVFSSLFVLNSSNLLANTNEETKINEFYYLVNPDIYYDDQYLLRLYDSNNNIKYLKKVFFINNEENINEKILVLFEIKPIVTISADNESDNSQKYRINYENEFCLYLIYHYDLKNRNFTIQTNRNFFDFFRWENYELNFFYYYGENLYLRFRTNSYEREFPNKIKFCIVLNTPIIINSILDGSFVIDISAIENDEIKNRLSIYGPMMR